MYRKLMIVLIAAAVGAAVTSDSLADRKCRKHRKPRMLPANPEYFGKTYGEWAAAWWTWGLAGTIADNPILDETGELCGVRQSGKVWYLAGTFGSGEIIRTCEVPEGKALLFPIVNAIFWAPEDGDTEAEVRAGANASMDGVDLLECTVDGVPLKNLFDQRAESPAFVLPAPEGSILTEFGFPAGDRFPAVADGFWVLLKPLCPGEHVINFRMHIAEGDFAGNEHDVTYLLTVVEEDDDGDDDDDDDDDD